MTTETTEEVTPETAENAEAENSEIFESYAGSETFTKNDFEKLRKENAKYRTRAKDLEKKFSDAEIKLSEKSVSAEEKSRQILGELDSLKEAKKIADAALKQVAEIKESNKNRIIKLELKAAAIKEGVAVDLDAVMKLGKMDILKLSSDEEVTGVDDFFKDFKARYPNLFVQPNTANPNLRIPNPSLDRKKRPVDDLDNKDYKKQKEGFLSEHGGIR